MKKDKFKVGLLTTINAPLLPFYISALISQGIRDLYVICDSKLESEKDLNIWFERTGGAFERVDGGNVSIYHLESLMIPFYFVTSHNHQSTLNIIENRKIKCLLNAGTPRKLSKNVIQATKHGVLNIHPGILPEYRGCTAVEWAILNDDKVGNTAHFMVKDYDAGPIITSEWYEFPTDADYRSIRVRVYRDGCILAGKAMRVISEKRITQKDAIIQDESRAKYWNPIPEIKMKQVVDKLKNGNYKYQSL